MTVQQCADTLCASRCLPRSTRQGPAQAQNAAQEQIQPQADAPAGRSRRPQRAAAANANFAMSLMGANREQILGAIVYDLWPGTEDPKKPTASGPSEQQQDAGPVSRASEGQPPAKRARRNQGAAAAAAATEASAGSAPSAAAAAEPAQGGAPGTPAANASAAAGGGAAGQAKAAGAATQEAEGKATPGVDAEATTSAVAADDGEATVSEDGGGDGDDDEGPTQLVRTRPVRGSGDGGADGEFVEDPTWLDGSLNLTPEQIEFVRNLCRHIHVTKELPPMNAKTLLRSSGMYGMRMEYRKVRVGPLDGTAACRSLARAQGVGMWRVTLSRNNVSMP